MKKLFLFLLILTTCLAASACKCSHPNPLVIAYTPATCSVQGATTYACNDCHGRWIEYDLLDHEYVSAYKEPTCKEKGYTGIGCKNCDYLSILVSYDTVNHSFIKKTVAPTCITEGYDAEECKWCGYQKNLSVLQKTDHDLILDLDKIVCGVCDFFDRSACDHSFIPNKTVAPTCTEKGYRLLVCERCNLKCKTDLTQPIPHDLALKNEYASSCFETGMEYYYCESCSYTKSEIIPPIPHLIIDGKCVICNENESVYTENTTISVSRDRIINIAPPKDCEVIISLSVTKNTSISAFDLILESPIVLREGVSGNLLNYSFIASKDGLYAVYVSGYTGNVKISFL